MAISFTLVASVLPIMNLPMALGNLPIAAYGLPLVPIGNDMGAIPPTLLQVYKLPHVLLPVQIKIL